MTIRTTNRVIHKDAGSLSKITVYALIDGARKAINLSLVTRMVLNLYHDEGNVIIDTDVVAQSDFIQWDEKGQVIFKLGQESELVTGRDYKASLIAFDDNHLDGQHISSPCSNERLEFHVCKYA